MKRKLYMVVSLVMFSFLVFQIILPSVAQASQSSGGNIPLTSLSTALDAISKLMMTLVPILIGLAIVAFLWGVMLFVFNANNDEKRKDGKWMMVSGIIGIVVMVSVWGLVAFVQNTFGLNSSAVPPIGKMIPSN